MKTIKTSEILVKIELKMFSISTRRALVLGFFFFLLENPISTAIEANQSFVPVVSDLKRFEQVIESGSTLTLTCIGIFDNVSTVNWASVPSLTRIIMVILKKGSHFNIATYPNHHGFFPNYLIRTRGNGLTSLLQLK
jgi:hypothetical protein